MCIRDSRRRIGEAVHPGLAEMAMECCDHLERGLVIAAGLLDAVAVTAQRALQPRHQLAALAGLDRGAVEIKPGRAYPMPDAGFAQPVSYTHLTLPTILRV